MTIFTNSNKQFATGNGVTTSFTFSYRLLLAAHLYIYIAEVLQVGNYTVNINTDGVGGQVIFDTAPADGAQILIHRFVPYTQESHLPTEDDFQQITLENAVDKLTMEVQQLQEQIERALKGSIFDPDDLSSIDLVGATGATGNTGATGATGPSYPVGSDGLFVVLEDQRVSGSAGGSITAGSWIQRQLNTKVADVTSICTLSGNRFTLPAGSYRIRANTQGHQSNGHQVRLRNITDGTTALVGTQEWNNNSNVSVGYADTRSFIDGYVTIAAPKTFELQAFFSLSKPNGGGESNQLGSTGELAIFSRVVIEAGTSLLLGPTGATGATGAAGATGSSGAGIQGATGVTGATGPSGDSRIVAYASCQGDGTIVSGSPNVSLNSNNGVGQNTFDISGVSAPISVFVSIQGGGSFPNFSSWDGNSSQIFIANWLHQNDGTHLRIDSPFSFIIYDLT